VDDDRDLSGVKVLRLFPLPGVVLFPHAVLPLHIFEERYKAMTEDALASDRLVTIVMLRPEAEWKGKGSPRYEEYGCVGRILKYERLADGRFNFLLLGLCRVRLTREVPSASLYRASEFQTVDDLACEGEALEAQKADLVRLFREFLEPQGGVDPELEEIISSPMPAGVLADILSHALPIAVEMKQGLLAERQVELRLDELCGWLRGAARVMSGGPPTADFPPRFSTN
jgi:Lon protease-like protein